MPAVARIIAVAVAATLLLASSAAGAGAPNTFRVEFDPPLADVAAQSNPDSPKALTTVTVTALGPSGRPVRDAVIDLTLTAPKANPVVPSDTPRITGRRLLHTRFGAPEGRYSFQYVLPIRGRYRLDLRAEPAPGSGAKFAPIAQERAFTVGERDGELAKFLTAMAALLLLGALAAFFIARPHMRRAAQARASMSGHRRQKPMWDSTSAPAFVVLALGGLIAVFVGYLVVESAREARSDRTVAAYQGPGEGAQRTAPSGGAVLRYEVDRTSEDGVGVQTLVRTRGTVVDAASSQPLSSALVRIEALDLENGKPAFVTEAPLAGDRFAWDHTYWDGVEYDATVSASPGPGSPQFTPASDTLRFAVEAMSPPVGIKLQGLLYLLLPFVLGTGIGVLMARRQPGRRPGLTSGRAGDLPATSGAR